MVSSEPTPDIRSRGIAAHMLTRFTLGEKLLFEGPYNLVTRNCQTTTKAFAEKIVKEENMDKAFTWPWTSSNVAVGIVGGVVAAGAACYSLSPRVTRRA